MFKKMDPSIAGLSKLKKLKGKIKMNMTSEVTMHESGFNNW